MHAFLCDLHNLRELHPFIVAIEDLPPSPELPGAQRYRIEDRIPLGPIRLRTSYVAAMEPVAGGELRGHAWQKPGVHLLTTYTLHERNGATELREHCAIDAPWLLRGFVATQARRAHEETLAKLKAHFEA